MKTTIASKFPKSIIIAFEKGYNFIPGIIAQPISSWSEAIEVKKALLKDAEKAQKEGRDTVYQTVIVDTADLAYDFCEQYIVNRESVDYLDETSNKRGYRALSKEFDSFFQDIVRANYTLIVISHSTTKQIKENGEKYDRTIPTIPDRGLQVLARLVDVLGYCDIETDDETEETRHTLIMRGSKYLEAGSRNPYLPEKIPLDYQTLCDTMAEAVEKIAENGGEVADHTNTNPYQSQSDAIDFKEAQMQAKKYAVAFKNAEIMEEYSKIVSNYLGRNRGIKECTEQQLEQIVLILQELKDYCEEHDITVE